MNKQALKDSVLLLKISEYFEKNPDKQSVRLTADLGEKKLYWNAVRESKGEIKLVEVSTTTQTRVLKSPK